MSANIFISFAGQDLKVAFTLCKALESRGFKCWISSRDILPGENFQVAIVRAIRTAKMMLLVFTGNSNNSEEMTKELALASQHKLIVVPLRIEDVAPNDAFAYEFATRQWIDFFADWETAINQLSERIAQAIPVEAEAAPLAAAPEPLPPPNPHVEPVAVPPAEPAPAAPVAVAPVVAAPPAAPAKEAAVATIERAPAAELKPPEVKPAAPEPAKAKEAPPPAAAPAAKSAPAKPAAPVAKAPDVKAPAAPGEKRKAPIGLFVGIGVVVLAIAAAAVVLPGMLATKPPASKPAAVVAASPPAAPASPTAVAAAPAAAPAGVVAQPASPDSNALAAAAGGNTLADPNAPPKPHHVRPKAAASHQNTEVPF